MTNLGAIMSNEMYFPKFSVEDLNSGKKTGFIRVFGCYGKFNEVGSALPFQLEITQFYPSEQKKFIVYGVPYGFVGSWDNPHESFSGLKECMRKFS